MLCLAWLAPTSASAQQRFAIDLSLGQSLGLTAYQRDVVYTIDTTEPDPSLPGQSLQTPYLADETNGWGTHLSMRFHVNELFLGVSAQTHSREQYVLHHQGTTTLSRTKQRPDRSYDDSGVDYVELGSPQAVTARERNRGNLLIATLTGGWSVKALEFDPFSLDLPLGVGVTLAHVTEPGRPFRVGLRASAGAQLSYRFAENFALTGALELGALATGQYKNREDAARRAQLRGSSNLQALTSNLAQATFSAGLTFIVR